MKSAFISVIRLIPVMLLIWSISGIVLTIFSNDTLDQYRSENETFGYFVGVNLTGNRGSVSGEWHLRYFNGDTFVTKRIELEDNTAVNIDVEKTSIFTLIGEFALVIGSILWFIWAVCRLFRNKQVLYPRY